MIELVLAMAATNWYVCDIPNQEPHAIVASYNIHQDDLAVTVVDSKTGDVVSLPQIKCAHISDEVADKALRDEITFRFTK